MCPRCGGPVSEPSAWSSGWRCQWHGVVYPLRPAYRPVPDGLKGLLRDAGCRSGCHGRCRTAGW